jgi:hypothetical protein
MNSLVNVSAWDVDHARVDVGEEQDEHDGCSVVNTRDVGTRFDLLTQVAGWW